MMPRCVICDYCSEVDPGRPRSFHYSHKEEGYVCSDCTHAIGTDLADTTGLTEELGELEVLVEPAMAPYFNDLKGG